MTDFSDGSRGRLVPDPAQVILDRRRAAQYAAVADIAVHLVSCSSPAEAARVAAETARMTVGATDADYAISPDLLPPCDLTASAQSAGATVSLGLSRPFGAGFTSEDASLLQRFAQAAAAAIETLNAVTRERTARRNAEVSTARLARDLEQRERYDSLLTAQKEIFEQIALRAPLADTLESIMRTIERLCENDVTVFVFLEQDGAPGCAAPAGDPRAFDETNWSAPLVAVDGTVLGAIGLTWAQPCEPSPEDESIIDVFAQAATVAVQSARAIEANRQQREATQRAYEERDRVASVLQTSLLPPALPSIPGAEVAARYRAGTERVGGDFYDVFPLQGHDWGIAIGDVCGKGPDAAALTALARHSMRAGAMLQRQPSRVLQILNQAILRGATDGRFATAVFARLTPRSRGTRMVVARGGHPPVAILRSWGDVMFLDGRGTLLGVFDEAPAGDEVVDLAPGDSAIFYTDGVVESRRDRALFGQERLQALLASCRGMNADQIAERIEREAAAYHNDDSADDMAIVVVTITRPHRGR